jgi:hypothetical protein
MVAESATLQGARLAWRKRVKDRRRYCLRLELYNIRDGTAWAVAPVRDVARR